MWKLWQWSQTKTTHERKYREQIQEDWRTLTWGLCSQESEKWWWWCVILFLRILGALMSSRLSVYFITVFQNVKTAWNRPFSGVRRTMWLELANSIFSNLHLFPIILRHRSSLSWVKFMSPPLFFLKTYYNQWCVICLQYIILCLICTHLVVIVMSQNWVSWQINLLVTGTASLYRAEDEITAAWLTEGIKTKRCLTITLYFFHCSNTVTKKKKVISLSHCFPTFLDHDPPQHL